MLSGKKRGCYEIRLDDREFNLASADLSQQLEGAGFSGMLFTEAAKVP